MKLMTGVSWLSLLIFASQIMLSQQEDDATSAAVAAADSGSQAEAETNETKSNSSGSSIAAAQHQHGRFPVTESPILLDKKCPNPHEVWSRYATAGQECIVPLGTTCDEPSAAVVCPKHSQCTAKQCTCVKGYYAYEDNLSCEPLKIEIPELEAKANYRKANHTLPENTDAPEPPTLASTATTTSKHSTASGSSFTIQKLRITLYVTITSSILVVVKIIE